ncbi:kinase-like protein, partial [Polyplosphaeria fusca]
GGMNAGISIVRDAETGKISIEKRFGRAEIEARIADNEIKALLHLKGHTHIPKMVDYFFDPFRMQGAIYLEYCKFGGMDQLIERHAMQRRTICEHHIWKWFIQLADALTLCHYGPNPQDLQARANWNWVIHRDIKPANCFLARGKKGTPSAGQVIAKLGDWGCGVTKQAMTSRFKDPTNMSTGTEAFMAPEQPRYYARSDVWQLGAVMFCLCTLTQCP